MPRPTATPATPAAEPGSIRDLAARLGIHLPPDGAATTCQLHNPKNERRPDDEEPRPHDPHR